MAKPNLWSLNPLDFTKMNPAREARIEAAPAAKLPELGSYVPNRIAAALHPKAQYLKVAEVIDEAGDAKSFVLVPDPARGTESLAWFSAGQYLSLEIEAEGRMITRPYSLASSPKDALNGEYRITVKRVPGGLASNRILDHWTAGTEVTASAPLGEFTYEPLRDAKTIVGLAGGSGVTAFRSFAKAIAEGDEDADLILLYGSRTMEDALYTAEFDELAAKCPRFRIVHVLSAGSAEGAEEGFLSAELIRKYAPQGDFSLFACGPQAMYDFLEGEYLKLGVRRKYIRRELYGEVMSPLKMQGYPGGEPADVTIRVHVAGKESVVKGNTGKTVLRALEDAGIHAPAHCRSGECGWCHSRLISGEVFVPEKVDGVREADRIYGYIHPCAAFPLTDLEIEVPPFKI